MIAVLYCTIFISMQVVQRIRETFFFCEGIRETVYDVRALAWHYLVKYTQAT
jgi:hypothetical protein